MEKQTVPVWLITGCSTGFGRELAKQVLDRGWNAVLTARRPDQLNNLVAGHEGNALAVALDVTDAGQVNAAVAAAQQRFGRVDVLVNNAGYGYLAAIEEGEDAEVRTLFETNFFGLVNLSRAVLAGMREKRSGTIVNISSVGGLVSFPMTGYYHATKYAVEGLSESLAIEVAPCGVKVIIVEPGPFRTDWSGRSLQKSEMAIQEYEAMASKVRQMYENSRGKQAGDPIRAAEAIIAAVTAENPPLRLLLGKAALENAQKKLDALAKDFNAWKETTLGADFPAA